MRPYYCILLLLVISAGLKGQAFSDFEINKWKEQAKSVTIIRDNWGVPHIYGQTDADAVFGMMYVQCEDFFYKVENAIISRLGRESEVLGKTAIYRDVWTRLFIDTIQAKALYDQTPDRLKKLCDAYAAGINYFMYTHPTLKPALLHRIQPWVPLMNNVPSVTGSNITEEELKVMYPLPKEKEVSAIAAMIFSEDMHTGSNGWAIAGKNTADQHPILLINPHSEFYNRIEVQLVSKEGLNVYGAPFLGEFHIWQGFNTFCGWMHTVTLSDANDLYMETIRPADKGGLETAYDTNWKPVDSTVVKLYVKNGVTRDSVVFKTYKTVHGPVVAKRNGQWLAEKTIYENIERLNVHWYITKSRSFAEFTGWLNKRVMTGTNTVYADSAGNIAYWHGNFVPIRKLGYDYSRPVPGNISATDWLGAHALADLPQYINPPNGWLENCNSTPLYATGFYDSVMAKKPAYMFPDGQTPRAMNAIRILKNISNATIDSILIRCYDRYLMSAARFIPSLITAYDTENYPAENELQQAVAILRDWDYKTDTNSIATTLAVHWIEKILKVNVSQLKKPVTNEESYAVTNGSNISLKGISAMQQVQLLDSVLNDLKKDWGDWMVPWGKLNRYQRRADKLELTDILPSLAVPGTPSYMGSLNAFLSRKTKSSKIRYGNTGNTFVAIVSFGKKLQAKSILTGGASTNPASVHFTDQAEGYINHVFKRVNFYKEDVLQQASITYYPGQPGKP